MIALSVAAMLAVFLLYTSIAGGGTPFVQPSELAGRKGEVALAGKVVDRIERDGRTVRFTVRDVQGTARVPVTYTGSVPDLFRIGRDITVNGRLQNGVFVGKKDTLVTKCPSKYTKRESVSSPESAAHFLGAPYG